MTIATTLETYLSQHEIDYELLTHPHSGSSHETAVAAHVPEDHVAKAVIVRDAEAYFAVVIPADSWLKTEAVNRELNRVLKLASEDEIAEIFNDCEAGAAPPVGEAYGIETLLDKSLTTLANVYFEAGDHEQLVHVNGNNFLALLGGARQGYFCHAD